VPEAAVKPRILNGSFAAQSCRPGLKLEGLESANNNDRPVLFLIDIKIIFS
jgi:hypothetical protein